MIHQATLRVRLDGGEVHRRPQGWLAGLGRFLVTGVFHDLEERERMDARAMARAILVALAERMPLTRTGGAEAATPEDLAGGTGPVLSFGVRPGGIPGRLDLTLRPVHGRGEWPVTVRLATHAARDPDGTCPDTGRETTPEGEEEWAGTTVGPLGRAVLEAIRQALPVQVVSLVVERPGDGDGAAGRVAGGAGDPGMGALWTAEAVAGETLAGVDGGGLMDVGGAESGGGILDWSGSDGGGSL